MSQKYAGQHADSWWIVATLFFSGFQGYRGVAPSRKKKETVSNFSDNLSCFAFTNQL